MHWQYTTCHHLLFLSKEVTPWLKSKASHNATKVDDETHHVSLNSFISSIFFALTRHLSFSKNKSSHDIAIKVDDKTHFSWPCREGPPTCCAFSIPTGRACNCRVFPVPFPGCDWKCFFCPVPFPGRDWKRCVFPLPCLQRVRSPVFFQFPFSFPVPFQFPSSSLPSSLRGFPAFFQTTN